MNPTYPRLLFWLMVVTIAALILIAGLKQLTDIGKGIVSLALWLAALPSALIISFASIIISMIALYYSQFQGPVIRLIEDGAITSTEYPTSVDFNRAVMHQLPNASRNLFVVNDGNRVGEITLMELDFMPAESLKTVFSHVKWNASLLPASGKVVLDVKNQPIVLPPKGGEPVSLSFSIHTVPWKSFDNCVLSPEDEVLAVLKAKETEQRTGFLRLAETVERDQSLGEIELRLKSTKRRKRPRWSGRILLIYYTAIVEDTLRWNLQGIVYQGLQSKFRYVCENWSKIHPTVEDVIRDLTTLASSWLDYLAAIRRVVPKSVDAVDALDTSKRPETLDYLIDVTSQNSIMRSIVLKGDLLANAKLLNEAAKKYSRFLEFASTGFPVESAALQTLNDDLPKVHKLLAELQQEFSEIRKTLRAAKDSVGDAYDLL